LEDFWNGENRVGYNFKARFFFEGDDRGVGAWGAREGALERGGGITGDVLGGVLIGLVQSGSFIDSTGGSDSTWRGFLGRVAGASGENKFNIDVSNK
jgi:hypothetical protein